jgi:hypothetical protein
MPIEAGALVPGSVVDEKITRFVGVFRDGCGEVEDHRWNVDLAEWGWNGNQSEPTFPAK